MKWEFVWSVARQWSLAGSQQQHFSIDWESLVLGGIWCAPKALIIRWLASSNVSTSHSTLAQHCPWATFYSTSYLHHSQTFWSRHDIFAPHTPPSLFLPLANMDINKIFKFLQKNKSDKKQPASKEIHSLDILRMARKQQHPKSRE